MEDDGVGSGGLCDKAGSDVGSENKGGLWWYGACPLLFIAGAALSRTEGRCEGVCRGRGGWLRDCKPALNEGGPLAG